MTLKEIYNYGTEALKAANIPSPQVDAFYLLEYVAKIDKEKYLFYQDAEVPEENFNQYKRIIERRLTREPYQYITGSADFMGLTFMVDSNVLIPRLDSEVLGERTLRLLGYECEVLDMCTGSGCIGIALKRHRPDIHMTICDISDKALEIAVRNAAYNHLGVVGSNADWFTGVRVVQGDLFEHLKDKKFDVIVSNPPYVSDAEYEELMPEVKNYEPALALKAGADGLDIYRRLVKEAPEHLNTGGTLIMEIGASQAEAVSDLMEAAGFDDIFIVKDLADLDRVVGGKYVRQD